MTNPIRYTSRTYNSILSDIDSDSDLRTKPRWWKRIWAGIGDQLNRMMDAIANLSFLRTAFTRAAVADLLRLIDYDLGEQTTSNCIQRLNVDPDFSFPISFSKDELVFAAVGDINLQFEARSAVASFSPGSLTFEHDTISGDSFFLSEALNTVDLVDRAVTGDLVRFSSSTGTKPSGISAGTNYWLIVVDDSTGECQLASSKVAAYAGTEIDLVDTGSGGDTTTLSWYSLRVTAYQQTSKGDPVTIGQSDGVTEWQQYDLPDADILPETIDIEINSVIWSQVRSLIDSADPAGTDYRWRTNSDNTSYVQFGNGTLGQIPGNFDIIASYATGGGLDSNVYGVDKISVYAGSRTSDVIDTSNLNDATGGTDPESVETAKVLGPATARSNDRFVTSGDGEALTLDYGGVTQVYVHRNKWGPRTAGVNIIPAGLAAGFDTAALDDFLTGKTELESMDVRIESIYFAVSPTSAIRPKSGFAFADEKKYYDLALTLAFSALVPEVYDAYDISIDNAIAYINGTYGFTFTSDDTDRLVTIIEGARNSAYVGPVPVDSELYEVQLTSFLLTVIIGIDLITFSSPSFPVIPYDSANNDYRFTNIGTITTTEIP